MNCRPGCAACCIAPSISTPIPQRTGQAPRSKPAGEPCPQLDDTLRCRLFGHPDRPAVCGSLQPSPEMCGDNRTHALHWLTQLEALTCSASSTSSLPPSPASSGTHHVNTRPD